MANILEISWPLRHSLCLLPPPSPIPALPPPLAAYAEKEGGGTTLFGRKSWKRRFFVFDIGTKVISYFESEDAQKGGAAPKKPPVSVSGYSVNIPAPTAGVYDVSSEREACGGSV